MRIYVASSWRNPLQPAVVAELRQNGFEVYDFRNPSEGNHGFDWAEIDRRWLNWDAGDFIRALDDPIAVRGYANDFDALALCDAVVLVKPSGISSHLELGWAAGMGKRTTVLLEDFGEPELMYKMVGFMADNLADIIAWLKQ